VSENKLYAVIVTYNGERLVSQCLGSLKKSSFPVNIVVVDNASADNTVAVVESGFPDAIIFKSDRNLGFGKANNIGIKHAYENNADYVFLLNQDAWVEPDTIQKLVNTSVPNPDYYVLSPVHLNKEGTDFDKGFSIYAQPPFCENWFYDLFSSTKKDLYSTTFINAAAWLIKRDTISQIGFFDPLFFHYGEDKDYCNRILYHNKKTGIATDSKIHHARELIIEKRNTFILSLKKEINKNYFVLLIELKRLDLKLPKLCLSFSLGLFYSFIKKILTLRFYRALIDILTICKLLSDIPVIVKHRKECDQTGEIFIQSINLKSLTGEK
jgi:GT2 family glycosyltransferase